MNAGQLPSRLRVKLSRVAESMEELTEVSAPTMPAMPIRVAPGVPRKSRIVSEIAVSEPAILLEVPIATATTDV